MIQSNTNDPVSPEFYEEKKNCMPIGEFAFSQAGA